VGRLFLVAALVATMARPSEATSIITRPPKIAARGDACPKNGWPENKADRIHVARAVLHWYLAGDTGHITRLDLHDAGAPEGTQELRFEIGGEIFFYAGVRRATTRRPLATVDLQRRHYELDPASLPLGSICMKLTALDAEFHEVSFLRMPVELVADQPPPEAIEALFRPSPVASRPSRDCGYEIDPLAVMLALNAAVAGLVFVLRRRARVVRLMTGPSEPLPTFVADEVVRGARSRAILVIAIAAAVAVWIALRFESSVAASRGMLYLLVLCMAVGVATQYAIIALYTFSALRRLRAPDADATMYDRVVVARDARGTSAVFVAPWRILVAREQLFARARIQRS
jgi:hypothetical protein